MASRIWHVVAVLAFLPAVVRGKTLWSSQPADFTDIIRTAYPIGNGQLAALPFGEPGHEKLSLNRDTLWSGGPFENASYNGGNPTAPVYSALPGIRDWIFKNGTGNVSALMGSNENYGSYYVLGNLSIALQGISNATDYKRSLDLTTGVHTTTFKTGSISYTSNVYCSYPDSVCVYEVSSTSQLPAIEVMFENVQSNTSLVKATCSSSSHSALFSGITQADIGMTYQAEARALGSRASVSCSNGTGILKITPSAHQHFMALVIAAGTNYDETKGTAASNYSFRGSDPGDYVSGTAAKAASKSSNALKKAHIADHSSLMSQFSLRLPDPLGSAGKETADIIAAYNVTDNTHTDPYLESLQFDYGRHLFISSSRDNSLPPNLQGKWAYGLSNAWGADYHANINLMNHWGIDQTGLGELQSALWTYMAETWAPRGAETAELLYDAPGWVVHDEVNIFGYSGMKTGQEYWADYPASAAWMMLHVADHFDYSQNVEWLKTVGYPMLEAISQFWLSQLQEDEYFDDGTLVVNPCSSPEHGPTTFGCAHHQQLLHSLFTNTIQASTALSTPNPNLTASLTTALGSLDKGLHITSTNLIQEWKLTFPEWDNENNTHRHLSHLIGWYPGSSLSSYQSGYTSPSISSAVRSSLIARGPGIADANAGWEKVWRSACWARLNDSSNAYAELRLTLRENIADNLLSMYSGKYEPFQIDANFGFVGAVLAMLVVDLPVAVGVEGVRSVVLGPAIPAAWSGGSVKGLRVRGGGVLDFKWDGEGVVRKAEWATKGKGKVRVVNVRGERLL